MVLLLHYYFQEDMEVKVNLQTQNFSAHIILDRLTMMSWSSISSVSQMKRAVL
jgi:hypothetical protein